MQILYLLEVWHCDSDGSGAAIADFGGARISDELALKKRRIQEQLRIAEAIEKQKDDLWRKHVAEELNDCSVLESAMADE